MICYRDFNAAPWRTLLIQDTRRKVSFSKWSTRFFKWCRKHSITKISESWLLMRQCYSNKHHDRCIKILSWTSQSECQQSLLNILFCFPNLLRHLVTSKHYVSYKKIRLTLRKINKPETTDTVFSGFDQQFYHFSRLVHYKAKVSRYVVGLLCWTSATEWQQMRSN